jgi:sterol desaturase/sphingolipid hydroxylase (fatty acid hydroxylase superfamily)
VVSVCSGFPAARSIAVRGPRCQHAIPFLWRLHALHHSDPDVDVTTSVRDHPIAFLIASAIYWLVVLALGIRAVVAASHAATVFAAASITHGNIRFSEWLERLLRPLVITLDLHLMHHSIAKRTRGAGRFQG